MGGSFVGFVMARMLMGGGNTIELGLVSRLMACPKGGSCVLLTGLVAWIGVMLNPADLLERPEEAPLLLLLLLLLWLPGSSWPTCEWMLAGLDSFEPVTPLKP